MNLKLLRNDFRLDGVFGELTGDNCSFFTLEHAYLQEDGSIKTKLPDGVYTCVRGKHQLEGMISDFVTFEITPVPECFGILFHQGNYNKDSSGCVLLGLGLGNMLPQGKMLTRSRDAFNALMTLQTGCDSFELTVESVK